MIPLKSRYLYTKLSNSSLQLNLGHLKLDSSYFFYFFVELRSCYLFTPFAVRYVSGGPLLKSVNSIPSSTLERTHLAKATFQLFKRVCDSQVIDNIGINNPQPLLQQCIHYITDNTFSNVQTRSNMLSAILSDKIPSNFINHAFKSVKPSSKVIIYDQNQGTLPVRSFAEIGIIDSHVNLYDNHINKVLLTGDRITVVSKSQPTPDLLITHQGSYGIAINPKYYDCKSGSGMTERPLGGTIGQLTYYGGEQLTTPNDYIDLIQYNRRRIGLLKKSSEELIMNKKLSNSEVTALEKELQILFDVKLVPDTILNTHLNIEQILYKIQTLPNFNKAISFINVINNPLDGDPMSMAELAFVKAIFPHLPTNIFSNPRTLRRYLQIALQIYKEEVSSQVVVDLKRTTGMLWMPSFLDNIDTSIFQ